MNFSSIKNYNELWNSRRRIHPPQSHSFSTLFNYNFFITILNTKRLWQAYSLGSKNHESFFWARPNLLGLVFEWSNKTLGSQNQLATNVTASCPFRFKECSFVHRGQLVEPLPSLCTLSQGIPEYIVKLFISKCLLWLTQNLWWLYEISLLELRILPQKQMRQFL